MQKKKDKCKIGVCFHFENQIEPDLTDLGLRLKKITLLLHKLIGSDIYLICVLVWGNSSYQGSHRLDFIRDVESRSKNQAKA